MGGNWVVEGQEAGRPSRFISVPAREDGWRGLQRESDGQDQDTLWKGELTGAVDGLDVRCNGK